MRLNFIATALLAGIGVSAAVPAQALDGLYGRVDAGVDFTSDASGNIFSGNGFGQNFGKSAVLDLGVGAPFMHRDNGISLRGEFQVGYHAKFVGEHTAPNPANTTVLGTKTDLRSWTTMANVYADFASDGTVRPYVGAGIGGGFNRLKPLNYTFNGVRSGTETGASKTNFAWSLMAGFGYVVSPNMLIDLGYKYLDAGDVGSGGQVTLVNNVTYTQPPVVSALRMHEITIGLRYSF